MSTPLTSTGPTSPEQSSQGVPVGGFRQWFVYIIDWIKGLSPAGATTYDTNAVTTGVSITSGTDWTVDSYRLRRLGRWAQVRITATYTGPDVTTTAGGNLSPDLTAATMPAAWFPGGEPSEVSISENGIRQWFGRLTEYGNLQLTHGQPSQTLTAGSQVIFRAHPYIVAG